METDTSGGDIFDKWDELELNKNLLRGIYGYGFEHPSPIQKKAIIPMINRRDIIAQAQSGTGKTGAFSISALQIVDQSVKKTQVLILAPTHELARQIQGVIDSLSIYLKIQTQLDMDTNNLVADEVLTAARGFQT